MGNPDYDGDGWDWPDEDERCVSCGADIDHYLGCPDDPDPDYEAEARLGYRERA